MTARLGLLILLALALANSAMSRERYLRDVPSPFRCKTCHGNPQTDRSGPSFRNGFGFDYVYQNQNWASMCALDSDGDGLTNAEELLDPNCLWRSAGPMQPRPPLPEGSATHPGDPDDPNQCGDELLQGSEACDGIELNGASCESLGFIDGSLTCADDCTLDVTSCIPTPFMTDMLTLESDQWVTDDADMNMVLGVDSSLANDASDQTEQSNGMDSGLTRPNLEVPSEAMRDARVGVNNIVPDPEVVASPRPACQTQSTMSIWYLAWLMLIGLKTRRDAHFH